MLVFWNILANVKIRSTGREKLNYDTFSSGMRKMNFITVKAVFSHGTKLGKVHYCFFRPSSMTCQSLARLQSDCGLFKCKQTAQC